MTSHEKYIATEMKMQNFRWATPGGLFLLTVAVGLLGWIGGDYLSQIRSSIEEVKTDQKEARQVMWQTIKEMRMEQTIANKCFNQNFNKINCRNCNIC